MKTTFSFYRILLSGVLLLVALLSTFMLLGAMARPTQAAPLTYVGGPITTNTTWTAANSPYILTETIAIMAGVTLTVEPGVTVMGQPGFYFFVEGHLQAVGTATTPITFTSQQDSAPNQWTGISFVGGNSYLQYVTVRYGEFNVEVKETDPDTQIVIEDSTISHSAGYGIDIALGSLHQLVLSNTTFAANYRNRISIYDWPTNNLVTNTVLSPQPGLEGYEFQLEDPAGNCVICIPPGITLTVEPGVTLLFPANESLWVYGHLEAIGTADSPITFTLVPEGNPQDRWGGLELIGSATLKHVTINKTSWGILIGGPGTQIEDSTISESSNYPLAIGLDDLHHLHISNVLFTNNNRDRVLIDTTWKWGGNSLTNNVTLSAQPGLEGYEFYGDNNISVPEGITLTVEPGVTLLFPDDENLYLHGHLEAIGTADSPITFTGVPEGNPQDRWGGLELVGSATLKHVIINKAHLGISIWSLADEGLQIEDSTISESSEYPLIIRLSALHRLHMSNVLFTDNYVNRILLHNENGGTFIDNATLSPQPGLEGYEFYGDSISVPEGITLTVEPGVTLLFSGGGVYLHGHLEAIGTADSPITFTLVPEGNPQNQWGGLAVTGSATLKHVIINKAYQGISIWSLADEGLQIEDSTISESSEYPFTIKLSALHRLHISNVLFANNDLDRIIIVTSGRESIVDNVTFSPQPGLEAYEVFPDPGFGDGGLVIPSGLTLTLQPGVTLMQAEQVFPLKVEGTLRAIGTAVSPITFTSSTNSAAGEWAGVVVSGTADFAHTTIRYAQTGVSVTGGSVSAVCTTFTNNLADGIFVDSTGAPTVTISESNIFGNGGWNILNNNPAQVDARYNWWGSPSGPGSTVSGNILTMPWLTDPPCPPPPPIYQLYLPLLLMP